MKDRASSDQAESIRKAVRESYGRVARGGAGSCCAPKSSCCETKSAPPAPNREKNVALALGYAESELAALPEGANMGLSCGNPTAMASLREGETVLDLGCGGGFDVFLAARKVGASGRVIGVDMTPDMIAKARGNTAAFRERTGLDNVDFRLGEIEHLPAADNSADVIVSNCVVNLSPDKPSVLREAFRVLKPGGRLAVSDIVAVRPLPASMRNDERLVCGCVGNAATTANLERWLREAGFQEIRIQSREESREMIRQWAPGTGAEDYVVSATIEAVKPKKGG